MSEAQQLAEARQLLAWIHERAGRAIDKPEQNRELPKLPAFSQRQRQILDLVCALKSNKEIAWELGLHVRRVEVLRSEIMRIVKAKKPIELGMWAVRKGLV